ncbi:MAG: response regulator [Alphaproteobacteria bacterium]|nr:response regulator [Alphaproteobacteria bacterium]MBU1515342.1 response regulator [Alphaproteobacteria bacterium]MBU2095392.1 response regulator [Alphaproteobacteria bacterium]MBU2152588.1 response regulator [Alphaproteobacteria bacterium]MBU2309984.1 response regulator [Alphaproteobacteria bacterium]
MFRATKASMMTAAAAVVDARLTAYQLTVGGLRLPVAIHYAFNAITAGGMLILGHPLLAASLFVGASLIDTVQQRLVQRWLDTSEGADEAKGFRRLAALCVARVTIYTAPTLAMAAVGGLPEYIFYGIQLVTLLMVAMGAGALSRAVFWSLAAPVYLQFVGFVLAMFSPAPAAGLLLALAVLGVLLVTISESTNRAISTWHAAFSAHIALAEDLAIARDTAVAERTAADSARETARQANRAKSNFLATMSHEIRTPMNGVLGMAQLMKRDETNPVQAGRLDVLIDSGEYLLSILNDILDVSKIDAGKLEMVTAAEDLHDFLHRLVSFWAARAEERGVILDLELGPDVPQAVFVDALRLRQVMFNLIGNALKFTDVGAVHIVAEAASWDDETVQLHLAVRDTGPGIAAHHLPHLFDRFSQADESETRRFGGTGLGLAIVKQLAELMGGRVWVESELGQGSTFHVEIPLDVVQDAIGAAEADENEVQPMAVEMLRVLAVDDNAVNLLVLDQLLTSLGHTVSKASSGAEALRALGDETFDLVLTDIQMPGLTGLDVLETLRAAPGPNQAIPVIALTADVTSGGRQRYLDQGFTEHAAKPIQLQDLLGAVVRAVNAAPIEISRVA